MLVSLRCAVAPVAPVARSAARLGGSPAGLAAWPGLASATAQARALRTEELHPERELARARVDDGIMETHLKKRDCDVSFDGANARIFHVLFLYSV